MTIEQLDNLTKQAYNDCWKSFRQYTADHDINAYSGRCAELCSKYGESKMVRDLVECVNFGFVKIVNKMQEEYLKGRAL